ncbi:3-isopropylmalate dehydratase small subunit [Prochlorococcus marinus XMU1412]|uniref:3-isopropylmalate dehydratase small subunit n=1 Tax=Prochlorococcus marinus TaxID=1219 RepID=UPI001ADC8E81|nr:3-isopropylmalate dehydratase small subunit [Prochlorococcus marinus]MBO8239347.1 3-isopropylmalate dehydratase small subunit [Prochlorococcus marinus XMU1412]MBW3070639.1 3-isopropylmalate dehydratase small subunit [Prochlorococcus marinus str. MU1412]
MKSEFTLPIGKITQIKGQCISLIGNDIDTDRIIPARFLKCVNFDSLSESVFEDDRETLKGRHPFDLEENKNATILIVNSNFGCGSSREHAPQALMRWGIKAIIAESFADIFYSNCIAIGIPCFTLPKKSIQEIQKNKDNKFLFLEIDLQNSLAKSKDLSFNLEIKESSRRMFLSGEWDATSTLLENEKLIENKFNDLPYLNFNSDFT